VNCIRMMSWSRHEWRNSGTWSPCLEAKPATGEEGKDFDFIFISRGQRFQAGESEVPSSGKPQIICESYGRPTTWVFTGPAAEVDNGKIEYVYDSLRLSILPILSRPALPRHRKRFSRKRPALSDLAFPAAM